LAQFARTLSRLDGTARAGFSLLTLRHSFYAHYIFKKAGEKFTAFPQFQKNICVKLSLSAESCLSVRFSALRIRCLFEPIVQVQTGARPDGIIKRLRGLG
jgi:hypothetical protein